MINHSVKDAQTVIDKSRRRLLVTIGRSALLLFMTGVTGFLFRQRCYWSQEDVNYTQLPCQKCRQLKGCDRPTALIYNENHLNDQGSS